MAQAAAATAYLLRKKSKLSARLLKLAIGLLGIAALFAGAGVYELQHAYFQAPFFSRVAGAATFDVEPGPSKRIRFPKAGGPYDQRLGYASLPDFLKRLPEHGYAITAQARLSTQMASLADVGITAPAVPLGLFLPYPEKDQAGLTLYDGYGQAIYQARSPERVYRQFSDVAPLLTSTLLYIENRTLLDPGNETRNPAIEGSRLGRALIEEATHTVRLGPRSPGASTLATQIEKFRHSTGGRTESPKEKLRQMLSASVRAYQSGEYTHAARERIVVQYLNTVPLAARPGTGEIAGIGDGMWAWYGREFDQVNRLLTDTQPANEAERAAVYKEALSLMISQRSPSIYLNGDMRTLEAMADSHLRIMARDGVIPPTLRDAALKVSLRQQRAHVPGQSATAIERKGASAVRLKLAELLGVSRMYDLDRLDMTATSTLDANLQQAVTAELLKLRDPAYAKTAGLYDRFLLKQGSPEGVTYSFTLIERTPGGNKVRVQADNFDEPFDINEGTKLDLGSTSKLRTLITYLQVVNDLHAEYSTLPAEDLAKAASVRHLSPIRRWAIDYLLHAEDRSLTPMLTASLTRTYSANPEEKFFTGGGLHTFENFEKEDNVRTLTVREATQRSVNLVYIRLMRDIVRYYTETDLGEDGQVLLDIHDPRRRTYLERFADQEGQVFLAGFYHKYHGQPLAAADTLLVEQVRNSPSRLAAVFRYLSPDAKEDEMASFIEAHLKPAQKLDPRRIADLYQRFGPTHYNLADRGFLARVHPLELWMVGYLHAHPSAGWSEMVKASKPERIDAYQWLYQHHSKAAQDSRIAQVLEADAFRQIHHQWQLMGYPFDALVPSYATALGASADRPAALAEMMGILSNDGVRLPTHYLESLHFAAGTPYDTTVTLTPAVGTRVLPAEVAQLVRQVLSEVVSQGTARRVSGVYKQPDGKPIAVGGKTGTGDNRFKTFGRDGELTAERIVSRSGAFVFYIGDRYFGTITAYVGGEKAGDYKFTSALPVQILKLLAPVLQRGMGNEQGVEIAAAKVPQAGRQRTPST